MSVPPDPLRATFHKPFAAQIAALRLRLGNLVPTAAWDDMLHAAHERAFTVAGAMKAEVLADLAAAIETAITEGRGLDWFRGEFRRIVEARGWHGWTGEGTSKGEAWRTKVIYRTNLLTSYAAGRMAQLRDIGYPLWIYKHGGSLEPRLHHLAWDGLILDRDDPFWATHAPPNGWGCSCRIRGAFSVRGAVAKGGIPGKKRPDGFDLPDPKTGVPKGIDKGWAYAPGASVADDINRALGRKAATLPAPLAADLARSVANAGVAATPEAAAAALGRLVGDDLRHNLAEVRDFAGRWPGDHGISTAQAMALRAWSHAGWHERLTDFQRRGSVRGAQVRRDLDLVAALIEAALERLPAVVGTWRRGVERPSARMARFFRSIEAGQVFSFEALSSFADVQPFGGPLQFVVTGFSGRSIARFSAHAHEAEILFRSGLQFRVLARTYRDGVTTVWIEELRRHRYRDLPKEARHAERLA